MKDLIFLILFTPFIFTVAFLVAFPIISITIFYIAKRIDKSTHNLSGAVRTTKWAKSFIILNGRKFPSTTHGEIKALKELGALPLDYPFVWNVKPDDSTYINLVKSEKMRQTRIKTLKMCAKYEINCPPLPEFFNDSTKLFRSLDEIIKKMLCESSLAFLALSVHKDTQENINLTKTNMFFFLEKINAMHLLNEQEKEFLENPTQDIAKMFSWKFEKTYIYAWALGIIKEYAPINKQCDFSPIFFSFFAINDLSEISNICNLKSTDEILQLCDFYFVAQYSFNKFPVHGRINGFLVNQRYEAFRWLLCEPEMLSREINTKKEEI